MILLIEIEVRREASSKTAPHDVRLAVEPTHTVDQVRSACATFVGIGVGELPETVEILRGDSGTIVPRDRTIGEVGLVSGDRLRVRSIPEAREADGADTSAPNSELRLVVIDGQDAGRAIALTTGYHVVQRGTSGSRLDAASLVLQDPKVSSSGDFGVDVREGEGIFLDPGPDRERALRVNGAEVRDYVELVEDDVIRVGSSTLAVRSSNGHVGHEGFNFGTIPFHRTPQIRQPIEEQVFDPLGNLPEKPKPRQFQLIAMGAPLLTGIAMAALMGSARFLLFAVMTPVIAVANHFDARRSGGNEYDEKSEDLRNRLKTRVDEVHDALESERGIRNRNSPDPIDLAGRASAGDKTIWNRNRESDDFLSLRFGLADVTPRIEIKPETQGDEELKAEVRDALKGLNRLPDVPLAVNLVEDPVVALVGQQADTASLATSLLLQASVLHSPEDLIIACATTAEFGMADWLKWLPHVRSKNSPLADSHLALSIDGGELEQEAKSVTPEDLLRRVTNVAELRSQAGGKSFDPRWPRILFVLEADTEPDPGTTSRLMDLAPDSGVSVVWVTESDRLVPRQASVIATVKPADVPESSLLEFVDPELANLRYEPARLNPEVALAAARRLAPLRDASAANAAAAVPTQVTLFDSFGRGAFETGVITPEWIAEQWLSNTDYELLAPIGLADTGPVMIDLVKHGPHGLIGGTSGAGKSELVQSFIGNLCAMNSPERLNLLFIDYKGGALSGLFDGIVPHSVGAVTNLSPLLAMRALTSLRAELDRRMALFEKFKVKDLREMLEQHPADTPASLVLVVDEFASLIRELEEFVAGIISIAERGRSLGIHLLLSTQRPSLINENIQQNTNLRMALRMLDATESSNVIGTADAATIPNHLKGRGFARLGPGELIAFQSAWSGAPMPDATGLPPVLMEPFDALDSPGRQPPRPKDPEATVESSLTQLDALVGAVADAATNLGMKRGRAPWQEPLEELISLTDVLEDERSTEAKSERNRIVVGMKDDPARQDQYPYDIDLETGCLVVFGAPASGKTTLLTTLAVSAALEDTIRGGGDLAIFGMDFGSRQLGVISRLPQCELVAYADNMEAVTRVIAHLAMTFERRQAELAAAVDAGAPPPPFVPVLLLVDGFQTLADSFGTAALTPWLDKLTMVATRGREVGIYSALTTGAFTGASARLANATSNRLALRQSDENGYRSFGLRGSVASGLDLPAGQSMNLNGDLLQIGALCSIGEDDKGKRTLFFDPNIIVDLGIKGEVPVYLRTRPLPEVHTELSGNPLDPFQVEVGIEDLTLDPVVADVGVGGFAVYGPPRSGRSTALANVGLQLANYDCEVWAIGPKTSPLQDLSCWSSSAFGKTPDILALVEELIEVCDDFPETRRFLLWDDCDRYDDMSLNKPFGEIVAADATCVGSAISTRTVSGLNPFYKEMKGATNIFFLYADDENGLMVAASPRPIIRPGVESLPGRGITTIGGSPFLAHGTAARR